MNQPTNTLSMCGEGSGIDSYGLSHDESVEVDDLDLNKNLTLDLNALKVRVDEVVDGSSEEDGSGEEDVEQGNGQEAVEETSGQQVGYYVDGNNSAYETQYHVESSGDAGTNDDDDDDENDDFYKDVPFENIDVISLVLKDVLEGEDVDVANPDDFDNDIGNDNETTSYKKRRLNELRREMEGVMNDSGRWKVNLEIPVKVVQDQLQRDLELQVSMSKAFRAKTKGEREVKVERNNDPFLPTRVFKRIYICLRALKLGFRAYRRDMLGLDGAFMKGSFSGQVLVAVGIDSNNRIYPLAYALVEAESKSSWWWFLKFLGDDIDLQTNSISHSSMVDKRSASAKTVMNIEKCMLELKKMNPNSHEWLKQDTIRTLGKISFFSPLMPTATRIKESIKKEAYLIKVQWNGGIKYQVSVLFGDHCVVDVVDRTCLCRK
ncbi:retrotransposon-related protein [Tanacetum coccineum]